MLQHKTIPVGSYCVNCSILWQGTDALVVDPGQDADLIVSFLSERGLVPQAILFTHGHFDHIGGLPGLLAKYPDLPVYAHPSDGLETPGHTPGSVCLKFGDLLLSGDTLFAGSCGRTDFPGGSMAAMRQSLAALATLPPETTVVPGHGPATTIGTEVATNPFME